VNADPGPWEQVHLSDEEIVRRVVAGDLALFEVLMRRHNQRVFRAARAILKDDAEAEDVMQDAYVRAYAGLAGFEERARFSTWLTRIAVHEALARVRRRRRFDLLDPCDELEREDLVPMGERDLGPEQHALDVEMSGLVEEAVDALPDAFRAVFMLRAVEELSTAETAACLGIPEDTVKTRLHRARAHIQRQLLARTESALPKAFAFLRPRCERVVAADLVRLRAPRA
jgi:RNA polymerase sigma-70 factor (ECF subfamily)